MIHGRSSYLKYGCRCDVCSTDAREYKAEYKKRMNPEVTFRLDCQPLLEQLGRDGMLDRVPRGTKLAWIKNGMTVYKADSWCIKFGYHPALVFGQDFYAECFDDEEEEVMV